MKEKQTTLTLFFKSDALMLQAVRVVVALEGRDSQRELVEDVMMKYIKKNYPEVIAQLTKKK